ncbi:dihydropteroate synthase [Tateyamaria sp. ANG-S1]|uniref:dihydropteroate synthase n=1 Tax=Tateyamaria sp. ANG-S1 TaxID=1577905 RepID=UPI00057DFA17|nr:dihydropteroate synthase [Tateyamaria sp. ANG-S1]KIC49159.1 dihydropteroate synthase [Tateyamaria sp. ANG-S1]
MRNVRPLMQVGPARPAGAIPCGGCWFTDVELLSRDTAPRVVPVSELTTAERAAFDRTWDAPQIMGILNTTPDSFSDGGQHNARSDAVAHGQALIGQGAEILDIGGESTRPGAQTVDVEEEIARTAPVIRDLRAAGVTTPISIDTRKAAVAEAALDAGASIVNDVSGFTYDPDLAPLCAARGVPVCVMHAQGDPQTMQDNPTYDDVLLDVYDFVAERIEVLQAAGVAKDRIIADPGIGFGKTLDHNLALLNRISLFHSLGVPILLGASRKRFIGTLGNAPEASARTPGSVAVALAAIAQGVQIIRAHDVADHAQAIALWRASVAHP